MTDQIKKLYKAGRNDKEFNKDLSVYEPSLHTIDWFWCNEQKVLYSAIYHGWLIGKGRFNAADYS